ncbi:MAG TPA: hypothetical protein VN700_03655 [Vicinamibacterales bacterium]|nr:hypothetical protein [Vicinamibacterales bacterium]
MSRPAVSLVIQIMPMSTFANAGILALLSMAVVLAPMFVGVMYAIKPSEARLALMRPLSLAAIFAALGGACGGAINELMWISRATQPINWQQVAVASAESLVVMFVGFGCLTVGWLCVALGIRRQG